LIYHNIEDKKILINNKDIEGIYKDSRNLKIKIIRNTITVIYEKQLIS
jgi:hypothetical protein